MDRQILADDAVRETSVVSEIVQATTSYSSARAETSTAERIPVPQTLKVRHSSSNPSMLERQDVVYDTHESSRLNAMTPLALDMYASAAQLPIPDGTPTLNRWNDIPLMHLSNTSSGGDLLGHIHDDVYEQSADPPLYWNSILDHAESAHFDTSSTSKLHKQRALSLGSSLSALGLDIELGSGHPLAGVDMASGHKSPVGYETVITQDAVTRDRFTAQDSNNTGALRSILPSGRDYTQEDRWQHETERVTGMDTDNEDDDEIDDDDDEGDAAEEGSQLPSVYSNGVRRGAIRYLSQGSSHITHFDRLGKKKYRANNVSTSYVQPYCWGCCLTPSDLPPMQHYAGKLDSRVGFFRSREQTRQLRQLLAGYREIEGHTQRANEVSHGAIAG